MPKATARQRGEACYALRIIATLDKRIAVAGFWGRKADVELSKGKVSLQARKRLAAEVWRYCAIQEPQKAQQDNSAPASASQKVVSAKEIEALIKQGKEYLRTKQAKKAGETFAQAALANVNRDKAALMLIGDACCWAMFTGGKDPMQGGRNWISMAQQSWLNAYGGDFSKLTRRQ